MFLNAGAEHVICIDGSETISDQAAILFSNIFYKSIFDNKTTICEAFKAGINELLAKKLDSQARKYLLKTRDEFKGRKHTRCECIQVEAGELNMLEPQPAFYNLPEKGKLLYTNYRVIDVYIVK